MKGAITTGPVIDAINKMTKQMWREEAERYEKEKSDTAEGKNCVEQYKWQADYPECLLITLKRRPTMLELTSLRNLLDGWNK